MNPIKFACTALVMSLTTLGFTAPVEKVVLEDFEGASASTYGVINASNSSASGPSYSTAGPAVESGNPRLRMTDPGGGVNGIYVTVTDAVTQPGHYMFTADVKVDSSTGGPISTFGMAVRLGNTSTQRIMDYNAGYVLNLSDHPTNGATLGYQTIGASLKVPEGGTFPQPVTIYFSTDPSGAPGDGHGDFTGAHRGSGAAWPISSNSSAVYIDNITRIGPGNFGEERHAWISIGDSMTNLALLDQRITDAYNNGFNCIDILARYRANRYYIGNRDFNTYPNPEPAGGGVNANNDPLQFAIDRAHELGMRVYASVSLFLVTDGHNSYPSALPSGSQTYVYNSGSPVPQTTGHSSEGIWADPGRADVRQHTLDVTLDIVQNYDVDGVIFDRIRYQGNQFGYNPTALSEMGISGIPSPTNASFRRARQDAITTFLHDAYEAITDLKPWVVVGTVPIAYGTALGDTYNHSFQHWPSWSKIPTANRTISLGAQDLIQPQFYRQWDSGGSNAAPGANRTLMTKALYGDTAVDSLDFGLMPGSNVNVAPLFATLGISSATDAANTAEALALNIWDTQQDSYYMNGNGIFSVTRLLDLAHGYGTRMIERIRSYPTPDGDVYESSAPLPDFLMKEGWDSTPPLAVTGASASVNFSTVNLTWTAPGPAEDGESASHYLVYRSPTPDVKPYYANRLSITQPITTNSFSDVPTGAGTYYYRIVPVDDYNNKGPSTVVGPVNVVPTEIIVESRLANGTVTPSPTYSESPAMASTTSKSTAPGLVGNGARYTGTVGTVATFRPNLTIPGTYDIYVTMGSGSNNNATASYNISGSETPVSGNVNLSFSNSALVNQWLLLESDVLFMLDSTPSIALENLTGNSTVGHRFVSDAVKFVLKSPETSVDDWQLY